MWTQRATLLTIHVLRCHSLAPLCTYEAVRCFSRDLVSPPISSLITRHPDKSPVADASCHFRHLLALCGTARRALPFQSISAETGLAPQWEMHPLLPWVALTRDFLGLFWCHGGWFVARTRWERSGGARFFASQNMSHMSPYDPARISRTVFTCQLDFACYSAKLASEGLGLQTNIQQKQQHSNPCLRQLTLQGGRQK